jgi:O-antigen ligase
MNWLSLAAWSAALFLSSALFAHNVALRLILLGLAAVAVAAAIARERRSLQVLPPVWLPLMLWAVWCAFSLLWSVDPERSEKEFRNEIVYTSFAFFVCYIGAQAKDATRAVLPVIAIAAVLVCTAALYSFARGTEPSGLGWEGGPQDHSTALLALMPCVIAALWYARRARWPRRVHVGGLMLVGLFLVSAYTTQNRTIWVGFALELLVIGGLLLFRGPTDVRTRLAVVAAALTIVAVAGGMMLRVQSEREAMGFSRSFHEDPRFAIWPKVVEDIERRPWTGYGFGRGILRHSLPIESKEPVAWHAHNLFLDVGLQIGIPGLVLLLVLLGATLRQGFLSAVDRNDAAAACGIALVAVVTGMATRNMTDTLLVRQNALFYWGVVGVLLAWGAKYRAQTT